jgi:hypothetical protein
LTLAPTLLRTILFSSNKVLFTKNRCLTSFAFYIYACLSAVVTTVTGVFPICTNKKNLFALDTRYRSFGFPTSPTTKTFSLYKRLWYIKFFLTTFTNFSDSIFSHTTKDDVRGSAHRLLLPATTSNNYSSYTMVK